MRTANMGISTLPFQRIICTTAAICRKPRTLSSPYQAARCRILWSLRSRPMSVQSVQAAAATARSIARPSDLCTPLLQVPHTRSTSLLLLAYTSSAIPVGYRTLLEPEPARAYLRVDYWRVDCLSLLLRVAPILARLWPVAPCTANKVPALYSTRASPRSQLSAIISTRRRVLPVGGTEIIAPQKTTLLAFLEAVPDGKVVG